MIFLPLSSPCGFLSAIRMPRIELNAEPGSKLCPLRWVRINFTFLSPRLASRFPSLFDPLWRYNGLIFWAALGKWAGVGSGARNPENERAFGSSSAARERDEDGKRGEMSPSPDPPSRRMRAMRAKQSFEA